MKKQMCKVPEGSGLQPIYGSGYPGLVEQLRDMADIDKATRQRMHRFGDFTYTKFFGHRIVSVMSPAAAEAIVMNKERAFLNEPAWNFAIGLAFKRGILLMDFEEHLHHRRIMQQAFTPTNLQGYLQEMQPMMAERVQRFPTGSVQMGHEFKAISLDMALEVFVGVRLSRAESDKISKAFIACLLGLTAFVRYPVPGGKYRRAQKARKVLEAFFYEHLPTKRARETPDLFSVLCHAESEEGHTFTDEDVVNHMIFFLFAAHDTSTTAMTTMAYHLARHPEWQARTRTQALELGPEIGYDTLPRMTELDLVMKEALRLNPPVPVFIRQARTDTVVEGRFIPKGSFVDVVPKAIHLNPAVWNDPETFDPERFAPDRREDKVHRFAWTPFGGGVHKCIGLYFAQMEIKTLMHHLLSGYEWSVADDYVWKTAYGSLGEPRDGLTATVRRL